MTLQSQFEGIDRRLASLERVITVLGMESLGVCMTDEDKSELQSAVMGYAVAILTQGEPSPFRSVPSAQ
jgi:hypothetical protein